MTDRTPLTGKTGGRLHDHSHYQLLQCAGTCMRLFTVKVDRASDLSVTHISDIGESEGYVIYRDTALVKCPDCKGLCKMKMGSIDMDIIKVK
jgi:hypothetical protein